MKKTLSFAICALSLFAAARPYHEISTDIDNSLKTNDFETCTKLIIELSSIDGKIDSDAARKHSSELFFEQEKVWKHWLQTKTPLTLTQVKVITRSVNTNHIDLVKDTLKLNIPSDQREHVLFNFGLADHKFVPTNYIYFVKDYLLEKSTSTNLWPLAAKFHVAIKYFPDKVPLISYDKKMFKAESDRCYMFFNEFLSPRHYRAHQTLAAMAEKYLQVCTNNTKQIYKLIERLDSKKLDRPYLNKYFYKIAKDPDISIDLAIDMYDVDKFIMTVSGNESRLSYSKIEKTIEFISGLDTQDHKEKIDEILATLMTICERKKSESADWSILFDNIKELSEMRK